jgi:hypothetical protein
VVVDHDILSCVPVREIVAVLGVATALGFELTIVLVAAKATVVPAVFIAATVYEYVKPSFADIANVDVVAPPEIFCVVEVLLYDITTV